MILNKLLTSIPGKGDTSDPVAIKIFLVLTTSEEPSSFKAVTWFTPVILPCPLIKVILFFLKSCAIPPVRAETALVFCVMSLSKFRRTPSATKRNGSF